MDRIKIILHELSAICKNKLDGGLRKYDSSSWFK
jgi:predicted metallopeptidase